MKKYIGTKVVDATPAWRVEGKVYLKDEAVPRSMNREDGYKVVYDGGYESWSPKDVFVKAYHEVNVMDFGGAIQLDVKREALETEDDETLLDLVVNMIIHLHELKKL